jgi:hypothetical protein
VANFTFELTDKRYFYSATKDKSMQRFMFAAQVAPGYTVEIKNQGQLATGDVTFFEIGDDDSDTYQGKISYGERTEDEPHIFSVNAYLPTTTFQNLFRTNLEQASIYLTFSTNFKADLAGESSVSNGYGAGETVWDVEKKSTVTAESISLTVIYITASQSLQANDHKKEDGVEIATTLVTDKLDELINMISANNKKFLQTAFHQLRESLLTTNSNTSANHEVSVESEQKIARILDRIFWAIVVVGGLIALNLLFATIH